MHAIPELLQELWQLCNEGCSDDEAIAKLYRNGKGKKYLENAYAVLRDLTSLESLAQVRKWTNDIKRTFKHPRRSAFKQDTADIFDDRTNDGPYSFQSISSCLCYRSRSITSASPIHMTYFPDLTEHTYTKFPRRSGVLNVGWLGKSHPFLTGETPVPFWDALKKLCESPILLHRGFHLCQFCEPGDQFPGNGQIRIEDQNGQVYSAPTMVYH